MISFVVSGSFFRVYFGLRFILDGDMKVDGPMTENWTVKKFETGSLKRAETLDPMF